MKHSAALSVIVFGAGYLTGIALVCEPQIYLKLAGVSVISYLSFILALQIEEEWKHNYHYYYFKYNENF